jgi:hypothetical protein
LALSGVGPESEAESGHFYERRVTKVGPGSQTRAAAGGLEAAEQGVREVHVGAAGRFRWRRTPWLMESVPVRKAPVQEGLGFGKGCLKRRWMAGGSNSAVADRLPTPLSSSVEMPENQRAVPPIANTGPDRSRKITVDLNNSFAKGRRGFLRHIASI